MRAHLLITFQKDDAGSYFAATSIKHGPTVYFCEVCKENKTDTFEELRAHVESDHLHNLYMKTICSICGISEEITENQSVNHFHKHVIDNTINSCRLSLIDLTYEDPWFPYSMVKNLKLRRLQIELSLTQTSFSLFCQLCNQFFMIAKNYFSHLEQRHGEDLKDFSNFSNVWCKLCTLKIRKFDYINSHAAKKHNGFPQIEFEVFPGSGNANHPHKIESCKLGTMDDEPISKKLKL